MEQLKQDIFYYGVRISVSEESGHGSSGGLLSGSHKPTGKVSSTVNFCLYPQEGLELGTIQLLCCSLEVLSAGNRCYVLE